MSKKSLTLAEKLAERLRPDPTVTEAMGLLRHCQSPARFHSPQELKSHLNEGALLNVSVIGSRALSVPQGEYMVWMTDAGHTMLVPTSEKRGNGEVYENSTDGYEVQTRDLLKNWNRLERVLAESGQPGQENLQQGGNQENVEKPEGQPGKPGEGAGEFNSTIDVSTVDRTPILRAMQDRGFTVTSLAAECGVDPPAISRILRTPKDTQGDPGGRNPSMGLASQICNTLRIDPTAAFPDIFSPNEKYQPRQQAGNDGSGSKETGGGAWNKGGVNEGVEPDEGSPFDRWDMYPPTPETFEGPPRLTPGVVPPRDHSAGGGMTCPECGFDVDQIIFRGSGQGQYGPTGIEACQDCHDEMDAEEAEAMEQDMFGMGDETEEDFDDEYKDQEDFFAEAALQSSATILEATQGYQAICEELATSGVPFRSFWNQVFMPAFRRLTPRSTVATFTESMQRLLREGLFDRLMGRGKKGPTAQPAAKPNPNAMNDRTHPQGGTLNAGPKPGAPFKANAGRVQQQTEQLNQRFVEPLKNLFALNVKKFRDEAQASIHQLYSNDPQGAHAWKILDDFSKHVINGAKAYQPKWKAQPKGTGNPYDVDYQKAKQEFGKPSATPDRADPNADAHLPWDAETAAGAGGQFEERENAEPNPANGPYEVAGADGSWNPPPAATPPPTQPTLKPTGGSAGSTGSQMKDWLKGRTGGGRDPLAY